MRVGQPRSAWRIALVIGAATSVAMVLAWSLRHGEVHTESIFASRIEQFSEPGGYFDTDNLISNEQSYLHPLDTLRRRGVSGGVYIGVGPDQNFSYIAQIRPTLAFIVDIRRDNLLLHLLFKALFQLSHDRAEYLSLLFGRPPPTAPQIRASAAGIRAMVQHFEEAKPSAGIASSARARVDAVISGFGLALTNADRETIARFHRTFIGAGLLLKFQSSGRSPRSYYPTYRDLLLETDRAGHQTNYLASEEAFQFVRSLQARDLVVPVVGNLAGDRALPAIARFMTEHGHRLSSFYVSNVELYLSQDGVFPRFVSNLEKFPRDDRSVIIRSIFGRTLPESVPGYYSTSVVQAVSELLAGYERGNYRTYGSLIAPQ